MGTDEEGTLERLNAHRRQLIDPKIGEHRGRSSKLLATVCWRSSLASSTRCAAPPRCSAA
jgi:hypothetical protein